MYQSQIAVNLKKKIDEEMQNFKTQNSLMTLDEQILNAKNKDELISIKNHLADIQEMELMQQQGLSQTKQKTKILLKKAGFVDVLGLCMLVGFIVGIGIGIGYILYRFGLK
ncbi:MAG: hypothetical protein E7166_04880 [Firmicutes bacterium]|nr:hypothetical protein [Bacillota bacterium]